MNKEEELKHIKGCLFNINTFENNSVEFRLQKLEEKIDELIERFDEHLYGDE